MDKEKLVRNIILCVSIALTIVFVLCGVYFLVEAAVQSAWYLALVLLCALCGGCFGGVAFYLSEN